MKRSAELETATTLSPLPVRNFSVAGIQGNSLPSVLATHFNDLPPIELSLRTALRICIAAGLGLGAIIATACASLSSLHSETAIDAHTEFRLGGEQQGDFTATVRNTGPVPIVVLVEAAGVRKTVSTLAPGRTVERVFHRRESAIFSNNSAQAGSIRVDLTGERANLGMRFDTARPQR